MEGSRTEEFIAQLQELGDTDLPDDVAVLSCRIMEALPAVILFMWDCYVSVVSWLGTPLRAYTASLSADARTELERGLESGCSTQGRDGLAEGRRFRELARAWDRHMALGARNFPPSLWFAQGVALRLGPSGGLFRVHTSSDQHKAYAELLVPLDGLPPTVNTIPRTTTVSGKPQHKLSVTSTGRTLSQAEANVIAVYPRVPNMCRLTMGCNANGAGLNAAIGNASKCADMLTFLAQMSHSVAPPQYAAKYSGPLPPHLEYTVSASATVGADGGSGGASNDLQQAASGTFRAAVGDRTNLKKTARTSCGSELGTAMLPGGLLMPKDMADGGASVLAAFAGRVPCVPYRSFGPVVERYFCPSAQGWTVMQPPKWESTAQSMYAALGGSCLSRHS